MAPEKLKVRLVKPSEVPKVVRMGKDVIKSRWLGKRPLEESFKDNRDTCWVAELDGQIAGAHFVEREHDQRAWTSFIVVRNKNRGNGIATHMHRKTTKKLKKLGTRLLVAEVETANKPSLSWHKTNGYKRFGRVPGWLEKRKTAHLFYKKL